MQWCCVGWTELGIELAEMKEKSLKKLLKKGIPRSTFSPIYKILSGVTNHCPYCGCKLQTIQAEPTPQVQIPKIEEKAFPTIKCPPCRGTGKVGDDLNCMTCLGSGILDSSNPNRARYDGKFANAQQEKLSNVSDRIIQKEAELAKLKPAMREDATPESVRNIR